MDAVLIALKQAEIFKGLNPLQITEIARQADRIVFNPGDIIMVRDEACDAATVIFDGDAVCLRDDRDAPVEEPVQAGSILAEMAMVVDLEASVTVVARSRVRAIRIKREALTNQIASDPGLAEVLIENITARLMTVASRLRAIDDGLANYPVEDLATQPRANVLSQFATSHLH